MAKRIFKIDINVHPAVARYLGNNFPKIDNAFDLRKDHLYFGISCMLMQGNINHPTRLSKKFAKFKPISIIISEYDFYHYGYVTPYLQQDRFSKFVFSHIIEKACYKIMLAHVIAGIPRDTAIKQFLDENLFEPDELNYSNLRKIYQRKYISKEVEVYEFINDIKSNSPVTESQSTHKQNTKRNGQFVPSYYLI